MAACSLLPFLHQPGTAPDTLPLTGILVYPLLLLLLLVVVLVWGVKVLQGATLQGGVTMRQVLLCCIAV